VYRSNGFITVGYMWFPNLGPYLTQSPKHVYPVIYSTCDENVEGLWCVLSLITSNFPQVDPCSF